MKQTPIRMIYIFTPSKPINGRIINIFFADGYVRKSKKEVKA